MTKERNKKIASSFGAQADQYDTHAGLQARVAAELAHHIPRAENVSVLEIGCGTGLFTEHLLGRFTQSDLYITDLSANMLETCKSRLGPHSNVHFVQCDGENIFENETISAKRFDIIATSMTIQWFQNPRKALIDLAELLNPDGSLYYATLGENCFPEWRTVSEDLNIPNGALPSPDLPGVFSNEQIIVPHDTAFDFFSSMKSIGASLPRSGYAPLTPGQLRKAIKLIDERHQGAMTWSINYGRISSSG